MARRTTSPGQLKGTKQTLPSIRQTPLPPKASLSIVARTSLTSGTRPIAALISVSSDIHCAQNWKQNHPAEDRAGHSHQRRPITAVARVLSPPLARPSFQVFD